MAAILQFKDENGNWVTIPVVAGERGPDGPVGPQGEPGDMGVAVYDPQGRATDIFAYVDSRVEAVAATRLRRFVTNDDSITPTGTYATSTYYNTSYGVKIGYCPDGTSILLSMQGGTSTAYETLYFTLASAPAGVAITEAHNTSSSYVTGRAGLIYACLLTGIATDVTISIAMSAVNSSYDYVTCAITVTEA